MQPLHITLSHIARLQGDVRVELLKAGLDMARSGEVAGELMAMFVASPLAIQEAKIVMQCINEPDIHKNMKTLSQL